MGGADWTAVLRELFRVLVFPGFAFLLLLALAGEWLDRKAYARYQHRMGPPWFQPAADLIKLLAKEDLVPRLASRAVFTFLPVLALAAVACAYVYLPVAGGRAVYAFPGDLLVVAYLLTLPAILFFLAGWFSGSPYGAVGGVRAATQLLGYEVPLLLAVLAPAVVAGSWSISEVSRTLAGRPELLPLQVIGLVVALLALQGKLERVPFDIPEAETEVVAGTFTEYSGGRLALFRLAIGAELVVGLTLISNLYLGGHAAWGPVPGLVVYLFKLAVLVLILAAVRAAAARLRIEQMVTFCWRVLVPAALLQLFVVVALRGWWLL